MARGQRTISCGALLRGARSRHGIDQSQLARLAGTSQSAVSRIERDEVAPTVETLNRLLGAVGETLVLGTTSLHAPAPGGGNQTIAELRADFFELSPEERLRQAAELSVIATELAAGAEV